MTDTEEDERKRALIVALQQALKAALDEGLSDVADELTDIILLVAGDTYNGHL